jgi:hypothetical protein
MRLKLHISDKVSEKLAAKILYAFEELMWRCHASVVLCNAPEQADIHYGSKPLNLAADHPTVYIQSTLSLYDDLNTTNQLAFSDVDTLIKHIASTELDPLGWTFRFLTLADEKTLPRARKDGNILSTSLPQWRQKLILCPIVEYLSIALSRTLQQAGIACPDFQGIGSGSKLLLTHDADATNLSHPFEIIYNLSKCLIRRDTRHLSMALAGLKLMGKSYRLNPLFGFEQWLEKFPDYKHTFYVSFRGIPKPTVNDVRSSASDPSFPWEVLKQTLSSNKVEYGIHPGINSKFSQKSHTDAKNRLEDALGVPAWGVRHHYWSINWKNPVDTYRKLVTSGYKYDTSMAYPDNFGLRAGTCLPYRPFDKRYNRPLNIYILPTILMDSWAVDLAPERKAALSAAIKNVQQLNGIINFDWHAEAIINIYPYAHYADILSELFAAFSLNAQHSAFPMEVVEDWHAKVDPLANMYVYSKGAQ